MKWQRLLDAFFVKFDEVRKRCPTKFALARRSGYAVKNIYLWRRHRSPRLSTFCDYLEAIGFELEIVRKADPPLGETLADALHLADEIRKPFGTLCIACSADLHLADKLALLARHLRALYDEKT